MLTQGHNIVVIGGSAGGVEALLRIVPKLPANLAAAVFVVIHMAAEARSVLPHLLSEHGRLPAEHAVDGEAIRQGRIYIAPPDWHLSMQNHHVVLSQGPKEKGFRPAIDPMFRSAAAAFGPRVVGVLLSGGLNDGTAGLKEIKRCGGIALVQDPADAAFTSMPASAVANVAVDEILPAHKLAERIGELVGHGAAV